MKTIGLIGGMSWESTIEYYRLMNELVKERKGGLHSAKCLLYSVDFGEIEYYLRNNQWDDIGRTLIDAAQTLEAGGAEIIVLCTNTMHKLFDNIKKEIKAEFLHIADAAAEEIIKADLKKVGLLGTRPTMEQDFYRSRLGKQGIEVVIPGELDREIVHRVIFDELCLGKITDKSKKEYVRIIQDLVGKGAQGIVLGCTEIPLLIKENDVNVPLFDTTYIHAAKAITKAIG